WWWLGQVELVMLKAVDMLANIGRKCCYRLFVEVDPFLVQLVQDFADHMHVVENEAVGHQMVELDALTLLRSAIVGNVALSPEKGPLGEAVKRLALVRRRLNR